MNKEVSLKIAKLLKQKGFNDFPCKGYYKIEEFVPISLHNVASPYNYLAPTIADVVMWLYETHNIWIEVSRGYDKDKYLYQYFIDKNSQEFGFKTPIKAYEAAIEYTLNNLI
jgi:hypothetical protein